MIKSNRHRPRRVPGTGVFTRALSSVLCSVMFAAVSNGVFGLGGRPYLSDLVLWGAVTMFLAIVIARAFMVGVWVGSERTRVRGWFVSVRFENRHYRRVSAIGYSGLLNEGNLDGSARFLKALMFQIDGKRGVRQHYVAGLIAFRGPAARQVQEIESRIQASLGAERDAG